MHIPQIGFGQVVEALFIVNETSSGGRCGRQWPAIEGMLREAGFGTAQDVRPGLSSTSLPYRVMKTRGSRDDSRQVRQEFDYWFEMAGRQPDDQLLIVIVGGDGTVGEVVQELADNDRVVFGVLPCGTGNDISRNLGIPQDNLAAAVQILRYGEQMKCGAYKLKAYTQPGESSGTEEPEEQTLWALDAVDVGVGVDAGLRKYRHDTGRVTSCWLSAFSRKRTYTASLLLSLARWRPEPAQLTVDGKTVPLAGPLNFMVAPCGATAGGGTRIAPQMSPESSQGTLVYAAGAGRSRMIRGFASLVFNGTSDLLLSRKFKQMSLTVPEDCKAVPVQVDGEPVYQTPLTVEWVPQVFTFYRAK